MTSLPRRQARPQNLAVTSTTSTQTQTQTQAPVLRLRGVTQPKNVGRRVQWTEDTVNNEGLGRKSSKVCCIYHAPKAIDESSDESSSDSSSDEIDSGDDGAARPAGGKRAGHHHGPGHSHGKAKGKRDRSPNAYEKMPKSRGGAGDGLKENKA
ncbi:type 1 phosphatases regulator ypi-1 [Calycina marina]|uniref:Type 1 phosphatases regulator n=1 Tax=Calycina marina TaxID=1763456 RepID=A0A9P8CEF5_9HELO|nr:type 1 phosphatases regulator ypi-1 [Calycina marina]